MNPWFKYMLGRLGLFLAVLLLMLPLPPSMPVKLLTALVVSFALSWFLLRRWRDEASMAMATVVDRRREERQRLRAALAGEEDQPRSGDDSTR